MVVVMQGFLSNMTHILMAPPYVIKMAKKRQGLQGIICILVAKQHPLQKSPIITKTNIKEKVSPAPLRRHPPSDPSPF